MLTLPHPTTTTPAGDPAPRLHDCDDLTEAHEVLRAGIREELRVLVDTHALMRSCANDILARLGVAPLLHDFIVGARVPVTVTVRASTRRHAERVAAAQIVIDLRRLQRTYLRGRTPTLTATTDPMRDAVVAVRTHRLDDGRATLARHTIDAHVLLAVAVTSPDRRSAWDSAHAWFTTELSRLRPAATQVDTRGLNLTFVRAVAARRVHT